MIRDDIIQMAREADREWDCDRDMVEWLERFADLVSKQERGLGFNQGYKQAIKDCVALLMVQHEAAKGRHNSWHVAAQLIQADVASDT